jgi:hypothetical protein
MIGLEVPPHLEVLIRKEAIRRVMAEFASKVLRNNSLDETLERGIVQRQIIESVKLVMIDAHGKTIGLFKMSIDWNKHEVNLKGEGANDLKFKKGTSITEQVTAVASAMARVIEDARRHYSALKIRTSFSYRKEIALDVKANEEAMKFLGHVAGDSLKWSEDNKDWRLDFSITPDQLNELSIELKLDA